MGAAVDIEIVILQLNPDQCTLGIRFQHLDAEKTGKLIRRDPRTHSIDIHNQSFSLKFCIILTARRAGAGYGMPSSLASGSGQGWTASETALIQTEQQLIWRRPLMAHKKVERRKELDRRRHRRAKRLKARIHEAQAAAKK